MVFCCGQTTVMLKVAALVMFMTFVLHLIGFASPFWSRRTNSNEGMWEVCQNGLCVSSLASPALIGQVWFQAVQIVETMAVLTASTAIILVLVVLFSSKLARSKSTLVAATVLSFLTVVFILMGIVIYATKGSVFFEAVFATDFAVGFAYILITVAMVGWLLAAVLLAVDLDQKLETRRKTLQRADDTAGPVTSTSEP
ncbi:uncharacterized protein LOC121370245 [Gigantopelta aegis]|uniref:uncharacterized protein LOC121370245 n=1 Tax=Gigantopelta aegis TaxID=1735272 RepID=UPI001B88879C|nr:uncharacterized protein LOC121370245 [Gigantopelta aegis]